MSPPLTAQPVAVQLDEVAALAAELAALAAELSDDAELCRSTAASFDRALDGTEGWTAAASAIAWARLTEDVADGSAAMAGTLLAAVSAYRAADVALAGRIASTRRDAVPAVR
jgi:hypothetical protein